MRMINKANNLYIFEKQVSNLVLGSIFFATFIYIPFLFARYGPIKLTVLSISASLILYYLIISKKLIKYKIIFLIFATNIFSLLLGFYFSDQKISVLLLGAGGRYNGIYSYLIYILIFVFFTLSSYPKKEINFRKSMLITGFILTIYGYVQYFKLDPFYNSAFGKQITLTFGNSNFSSAFMALCSSVIICEILFSDYLFKTKLILSFLYAVQGFLIYLIGDLQGIFVFFLILISCGLLKTSLLIRQNFKYKFFFKFSLLFSLIFIVFITSKGMGLFYSFFKTSSFIDRIYIWEVGLEIFKNNWLWGIGYDAFIEGYPKFRTQSSILGRDVDINSYSAHAHNIFLNIGATGGVFLLLSFLFLTLFISIQALKLLRLDKMQSFYLIFVWLGYLTQSMVSIDNLILSSWGFASAGLIVSNTIQNTNVLEKVDFQPNFDKVLMRNLKNPFLNSVVIFIVTVLLYLPFFNLLNQFKFQNMLSTINSSSSNITIDKKLSDLVEAVAKLTDLESKIYLIKILVNSKYFDEAIALAIDQTVTYPNRVLAWDTVAIIYEGLGKKDLAIAYRLKTIELDPLNYSFRDILNNY